MHVQICSICMYTQSVSVQFSARMSNPPGSSRLILWCAHDDWYVIQTASYQRCIPLLVHGFILLTCYPVAFCGLFRLSYLDIWECGAGIILLPTDSILIPFCYEARTLFSYANVQVPALRDFFAEVSSEIAEVRAGTVGLLSIKQLLTSLDLLFPVSILLKEYNLGCTWRVRGAWYRSVAWLQDDSTHQYTQNSKVGNYE